jgi:hypothetical protein
MCRLLESASSNPLATAAAAAASATAEKLLADCVSAHPRQPPAAPRARPPCEAIIEYALVRHGIRGRGGASRLCPERWRRADALPWPMPRAPGWRDGGMADLLREAKSPILPNHRTSEHRPPIRRSAGPRNIGRPTNALGTPFTPLSPCCLPAFPAAQCFRPPPHDGAAQQQLWRSSFSSKAGPRR